MAARRLVVLMLVLLFLTSLATALAPVDRDPAEAPVPEKRSDEAAGAPTRFVRETIAAREDPAPVVSARVGDQLQLRVRAGRVVTIEIPRLGATDDAAPGVAALFDLFLDAEGTYRIRELETRRPVGTIEVGPAARVSPPPARPERPRAQAPGPP